MSEEDDPEQWRKRWKGWYGHRESDYKDWLNTQDCADNREALAKWALAHDGIMGDAYGDLTQRHPNAALTWTATLLHCIINGNPTGISLPAVLSYAGDSEDEMSDVLWLIRNGWLKAYTMPNGDDTPDDFDDRLQPISVEELPTVDEQRVWVRHTYSNGKR